MLVNLGKERSAADDKEPMPPIAGDAGMVLVVGGSRTAHPVLADILTPAFRCHLAASGEEAITAAHAHPPDVILVDQAIGAPPTAEFCRRVRADSLLRAVPILLVTSSCEPEDQPNHLLEGVDDYIFAPLRPREVLTRVFSLVRLRHAQLERELLLAVRAAAARLPHEVNNPLAFVSGGLEQLCESLRNLATAPPERLRSTPELRAELEQIEAEVRNGVQRIRSVVQNLALLADSGLQGG
jgi:DNA-binding response OmpR family regulator